MLLVLADPDDRSQWDTAIVIGQEGTGTGKPNADGHGFIHALIPQPFERWWDR